MGKRAQFYYQNPCSICEEAKAFLEENGVILIERDVSKTPLNKRELSGIMGYHNPKHYLDSKSSSFKKQKLDSKLPSRDDLLDLIMENQDLLKYPIIRVGRLMTIGSNRQQLIDMFQINMSDNGNRKNGRVTDGNK
ncbi:MAG: hypothetical protein GY841_22145 [FCB group bacterium]|nr:hypothetical protein [FCB group bacterium]